MKKSRSITSDQVIANFEYMRKLCDKLGDRKDATLAVIDGLGERLAECPASAKVDYHNCFPGGLVEHSIRVLRNSYRTMKAFKIELPEDSLIISCLFHDLGKVGNHEESYYIPHNERWKFERGQMYEYNNNIQYMTVPQRGVWLCQHYGLKLTQEEFLAIILNDGQYADENKPYRMKEPNLAFVLHSADLLSTRQEKDMWLNGSSEEENH